MAEHEVYVRAIWHDGVPVLEIICICGKVLRDRDESEISVPDVMGAVFSHMEPVKPEPVAEENKPVDTHRIINSEGQIFTIPAFHYPVGRSCECGECDCWCGPCIVRRHYER